MMNLNTIPPNAFMAFLKVDATLVGTPDYAGIAYFWNTEYKHQMRNTTTAKRRLVHQKFLAAGLKVDGDSPQHQAIVDKYSGVK